MAGIPSNTSFSFSPIYSTESSSSLPTKASSANNVLGTAASRFQEEIKESTTLPMVDIEAFYKPLKEALQKMSKTQEFTEESFVQASLNSKRRFLQTQRIHTRAIVDAIEQQEKKMPFFVSDLNKLISKSSETTEAEFEQTFLKFVKEVNAIYCFAKQFREMLGGRKERVGLIISIRARISDINDSVLKLQKMIATIWDSQQKVKIEMSKTEIDAAVESGKPVIQDIEFVIKNTSLEEFEELIKVTVFTISQYPVLPTFYCINGKIGIECKPGSERLEKSEVNLLLETAFNKYKARPLNNTSTHSTNMGLFNCLKHFRHVLHTSGEALIFVVQRRYQEDNIGKILQFREENIVKVFDACTWEFEKIRGRFLCVQEDETESKAICEFRNLALGREIEYDKNLVWRKFNRREIIEFLKLYQPPSDEFAAQFPASTQFTIKKYISALNYFKDACKYYPQPPHSSNGDIIWTDELMNSRIDEMIRIADSKLRECASYGNSRYTSASNMPHTSAEKMSPLQKALNRQVRDNLIEFLTPIWKSIKKLREVGDFHFDKTCINMILNRFKIPVEEALTLAQIKKLFTLWSLIGHPDKGGNGEQFTNVKEAREKILSIWDTDTYKNIGLPISPPVQQPSSDFPRAPFPSASAYYSTSQPDSNFYRYPYYCASQTHSNFSNVSSYGEASQTNSSASNKSSKDDTKAEYSDIDSEDDYFGETTTNFGKKVETQYDRNLRKFNALFPGQEDEWHEVNYRRHRGNLERPGFTGYSTYDNLNGFF